MLYFCGRKREIDMPTGLGIAATGVAYLNYRNAKREYEDLLEKRDGLLAVVKMFNKQNDEAYGEQFHDYISTKYPKGVKCSAILRTSYLVGKYFHCLTSVVISNFSDKTYEIGNVSANCWVQDIPIMVYDSITSGKEVTQNAAAYKKLMSGETLEIPITGGISAVPDMNALRGMVCAACGKRLITSCGKVSIEDGIKVNIDYTWREEGEKEWHTARYKQLNGVFRYCMELPLYVNS